jgi:hypothetical protein
VAFVAPLLTTFLVFYLLLFADEGGATAIFAGYTTFIFFLLLISLAIGELVDPALLVFDVNAASAY